MSNLNKAKKLGEQIIESGLFTEYGIHISSLLNDYGDFVFKLKDTDFKFLISFANYRFHKIWYLGDIGDSSFTGIKFEEVLSSVKPKIAEQLLFHLDLFD